MDFFKNLANERTVNLYVAFAVALLGVIAGIVYSAGFGAQRPEFYNVAALIFPLVGLVAYVGLALFKHTAPYACTALWVCAIMSLIVYVVAAYMHLAEVFYSGVNAETMKLLDGGFVACLVMYLLYAIAANVVMWIKIVPSSVGGVKS